MFTDLGTITRTTIQYPVYTMHALLMWVISTRMPAHFKYYIDTNGMSPSVIPFNYNHPITSDT